MKPQPMGADGLKREVGLGSATVLVIANMVGTGVFTTSGFILAELGSVQALMACWLLGGLFALVGALCYGELGAMLPRAGGEYAYLRQSFGPLPAFLSGWISLIVGFSAPIAAAAIAFAVYLLGGEGEPWLALEIGGRRWLSLSPVTGLAIAAVLVLSLLHYHSVRLGRRVQNLLTGFKIAFILLLGVGGLLFGNGDGARLASLFGPADFSLADPAFAVSLIFVSFAYSGWNAAAYIGGEIRRPGRNLPLSLLAGTVLVIGLYLLLNLAYVFALPVESLSGTLELGMAAGGALFGPGFGRIVGTAIALGLLSVISAMVMAGPRVYYAMACDGVFFSRFCSVDRGHSPGQAIVLQAGLAILMILSSAFETLLVYIGFTLSLTAMLAVAGLVRMRFSHPDLPRPYRTLGYPLTPLAFIAGNLWIVAYSLVSHPLAGLYGIATIVAGVACYWMFRPGRKRPGTEVPGRFDARGAAREESLP